MREEERDHEKGSATTKEGATETGRRSDGRTSDGIIIID